VSGSEDGGLALVTPTSTQPLWHAQDPSGCVEALAASGPATVVAVGSGTLREWDVRVNAARSGPSRVLRGATGGLAAAVSIACHPGQPYLVAVGDSAGSLHFHDLRGPSQLTSIRAHDGPITAVRFHAHHPNVMATCGMDGRALLWDFATYAAPQGYAEGAFSLFEAHSESLPLHSLDISGFHVATAGDAQNIAMLSIRV
jgi:WD40 repeat protein